MRGKAGVVGFTRAPDGSGAVVPATFVAGDIWRVDGFADCTVPGRLVFRSEAEVVAGRRIRRRRRGRKDGITHAEKTAPKD